MLLFQLLSMSIIALAAPAPKVLNFTYSGTGCKSDTMSLDVGSFYEPTNTIHLTRILYEFYPYIGPGTIITDRTKQCVLKIDFAIDTGYALRADTRGVFVRGYAGQLGIKDTMLVRSNISWVGSLDTTSVTELVQGSIPDRYGRFENTTVPQNATQGSGNVYKGTVSPCGGGTMVWDFKATARPGSSQPGGGWEEPSEDDDNWYTTNDVEVRPC